MPGQNSNCLLCFKTFEGDLLQSQKPGEYCKRVFDSCVKYLKKEIKGTSFHWNHSEEQNNRPFCSICFDLADKMLQIDEQLEKITESLYSHIQLFSKEILKARNASPAFDNSQSDYQHNKNNIRNNSAANECQGTNEIRVDSGTEHQVSSYELLPIKDEPVDQDDNYFSDGHDSLFDVNDMREDFEIKIEKSSEEIENRLSCGNRPKRKSAMIATEILKGMEIKTEPDLESNSEYSEIEFEIGSDKDYNEFERDPVGISESSDEESVKEFKLTKSKLGERKTYSSSGSKGFKCAECSMIFSQTKELDDHSEESGHHNEKKYQCSSCDKSYYRGVDLKYHRRTHRDDDRTYTCSICEAELQTYRGYMKHCKSHTGKFFNCSICVTNFISEEELSLHMNTHSSSELTCSICGKYFKYRLHLKYHLLCHEKKSSPKTKDRKGKIEKRNRERGFVCKVCNSFFKLGRDLDAHSTLTGHVNEKNYHCSVCSLSYYRGLDLKYHTRRHKNAGRYKCEHCNKIYNKSTSLRDHVRRHNGNTFDCTECDKKFTTQKNLEDHMNTHTGATPYPCDACDQSFSSQKKLGRHKLVVHKRRKLYGCTLCEMKLTTNSALTYHMYTHTGEKPFKCSFENCPSTYTTSKKLRLHVIRAHTDIEPTIKCDLCERKFKVVEDMKKHRSKHPDKTKSFMCDECGKCFCSSRSLKNHKARHTHTGDFFICEFCPNTYTARKTLDRHIKECHGKNSYFCELCGAEFKRAKQLKLHNLQEHKGENFLYCDVCNKKFTKRKNLTIHKRTHATVREKFECDECGQSYLSKKGLRFHKKVHTGGKEHLCHTCKQRFTDKDEFKKHIKAHEGADKRFKCDQCGAGYTRSDNLRKHQEKCKKDG